MEISRRAVVISGLIGASSVAIAHKSLELGLGSDPAFVPRDNSFPRIPIGMNLAGIADWDNGFPFRNLFLGARPWLTRNLSGVGPFNTNAQASFQFDQNGYPTEVPVRTSGFAEGQVVFTFMPNRLKPGIYYLLYDGEGEIEGLAATRVLSSKPGCLKLHMSHSPDTYEAIVINRSKRGNHIRNIRVVAEVDRDIDLTRSPFRTDFLEFCQQFHCLRFMDWGATNNSIEENWQSRRSPTFYTMVGGQGDPEANYGPPPSAFDRMFSGGVAFELMIQLSNLLKIDPWFCVPHRATDDYIEQLATLVKNTLDPTLTAYIEYSNEIWNWGFFQAGWMLRSPLAGALVEAKGGRAWKDAAKTQGEGHPERIGALFRRNFAIWERVWNGAHRKRLVRVCSVQAGWFDASQRTIQWCLDNGGADAVSPTAYVGPDDDVYQKWAVLGARLTPEMVLDDMEAVLASMRNNSAMVQTIRLGKKNGLRYVAYEGGQHLQPKGQADLPYAPALAAAQSHPRMYDLYVDLMRLNRDLGCSLFNHFSSVGQQGTRWGSWGAKASYDTPDASSPKMRALQACNTPRDSASGA